MQSGRAFKRALALLDTVALKALYKAHSDEGASYKC